MYRSGFIGRAWMLAVITLPLFSQETDKLLTLRSNTRLVQLDVVAEDKKGRPVTDLTRENFEVYDQGKLQQIRIFTRDATAPVAAATVEGGNRVFNNMAEARSGPAGVTVILIDSLNTKWVNQAYARQQIIKYLRQIHPEDHVAIYSMGMGGFRVLHDFTQDASDLVAKLNGWKGEATPEKSKPEAQPDIGQQLGDWLQGKNPDYVQSQEMGDYDRFSSAQSLRLLTAIANQLAGIPGRKNLIWISEGFPVVNWGGLQNFVFDPVTDQKALKMSDPQSVENQMINAMRAISDDNVSIYPVNAACLYDPFYSAGSQDPHEVGMKALVSVHGREEVMSDIAKKTGGKAFYESNDIKNAIRVAMDDSKFSYTLGYYPEAVQFNGKFRTLRVKVAGRTDVRLRYRQGYIDSPEPVGNEAERRLKLQNAVWSPLDANAIGLSARMERAAGGGGRLVLKINAADIGFSQNGDARLAEADIMIVQKDERGKQLDLVQETARVEVNPARYSEIARDGIILTRDIVFKPGVSALRVVVGDANSSRLGSLTIPDPDITP